MPRRLVLNPVSGNLDVVETAGVVTALANCQSSDGLYAVVYITGDKVGSRYQVAKADVADNTKMPGVGLIIKKSTATECTILLFGVIGVSSTLTPGDRYFISASGYLTKTPPSPSVGGYAFVHPVGVALDSNELFFNPHQPFVKRVW